MKFFLHHFKRCLDAPYYDYTPHRYTSLWKYDRLSFNLLRDLIEDKDESFNQLNIHHDKWHYRIEAARALGECPFPLTDLRVENLYKFIEELYKNSVSYNGRRLKEELMFSLYRLGKRQYAHETIRYYWLSAHELRERNENYSSIINAWNELGWIYYRVGEYQSALEAYTILSQIGINKEGISEWNQDTIIKSFYYKAMMKTYLGRYTDATLDLKEALENGFNDWKRVMTDNNLNELRATDEFRTWLEEIKNDERYGGFIDE